MAAQTNAAIDPLLAIPGLVQEQFKRVVVLKAVPVVTPLPDTLINVPTKFETSSPESYDIPLTLLGQSVVITATAESWTWQFGDGSSETVTVKGARGRTTHTYESTGTASARADIIWSGTYRLNGGPPQPIAGTATTLGETVGLQIKQARVELIAP